MPHLSGIWWEQVQIFLNDLKLFSRPSQSILLFNFIRNKYAQKRFDSLGQFHFGDSSMEVQSLKIFVGFLGTKASHLSFKYSPTNALNFMV